MFFWREEWGEMAMANEGVARNGAQREMHTRQRRGEGNTARGEGRRGCTYGEEEVVVGVRDAGQPPQLALLLCVVG